MKNTVFANVRFGILGLSLVVSSAAFAVSTDLSPFVTNSGQYVNAVTEQRNLCATRYSVLDLEVIPSMKSVKVILSGSGMENGHPTAGEETIELSLQTQWERPILVGREEYRTVLKGDTVLEQVKARTIERMTGWEDSDSKVIQFVDGNSIVYFGRDGIGCKFNRR